MPPHDAERLALANEVRQSLALENELQPIQARSFVRSLQTFWQVPTIRWRDDESRMQLEDARRLIHTAQVFRQLEGAESQNALDCFRRAGELLEWLSRASDPVRTIAPIELLASAAYQLGGLPAMAAGLLRQVELDDEGARLFASFLRADFDDVLRAVSEFWRAHLDLTTPDTSRRLLVEEADDRVSWYIVVEIVRSLGLVAVSLRQGNKMRLERALLKLEKLDKLAIRALPEDVSLFLGLLTAVATGYKTASIYGPILQLAELNPDFTDRLQRFARGQFSRGRGILWASQQQGLDRLLHQSSFALCTPTGSGKTLVAILALVKELLLVEDERGLAPLGLYLVPSRALAGEVEAKLTAELGDDFVITGLYGGSDWGITDYWLNSDQPTVLIATVEKADALMRYLGPILLARLRLLVVDEAHQVVAEDTDNGRAAFAEHSSRSIRLEAFVSRLLSQSPDIVRVALTAVAGGAALPVARWMEGRAEAEPVGINYRSTRQIIGMLESNPRQPSRLQLELMNDRPLYVRGRDEPVYLDIQTPAMPQLPANMRDSVNRFNQLNALWTALHLLEGQRRILISVAQQPERTMRWFAEAFALPDWHEIGEFTPPEDENLRARFDETRVACVDYCGEDSYELALLDHGVATNHGQMPQRLRRLMTDLIDRRICPITVATATLTEGVNLPFDLIFLTSLKRRFYDQEAEELKETPLSTAEFRNLAGRAGRPGASKGMEGLTLIPVPQRPSTTAQGQRATQLQQVRQAQGEYEDLIHRLLAEGGDDEGVICPLSLLLRSIYERAAQVLGIADENAFLAWLEAALPRDISDRAGLGATSNRARLADSVDELDGVVLSAIEELSRTENRDLTGPEAEAFLVELWKRTFTSVAAVQEDWLEQAFVRRGRAIVETIYPDSDERKRLYQYGFSPYIGRRFEAIREAIREELEGCVDYGLANPDQRLAVFQQLGALVENDRGFGFRVRQTDTDRELLANWTNVLAWWMQAPDAPRPEPEKLRAWQRFVADNLEFRLGVAVGAVVAQAWSDGAGDPLAIPSLAEWKETTGLPWFGFWAKELLRWGTLDPFTAFALAQGLARTREEAAERRPEFVAWLEDQLEVVGADDHIDPQNFLEWQRALARVRRRRLRHREGEVELTGTNGQRAPYSVLPVETDGVVNWIDAAGFSLAQSDQRPPWIRDRAFRDDFELRVHNERATVQQIFFAR